MIIVGFFCFSFNEHNIWNASMHDIIHYYSDRYKGWEKVHDWIFYKGALENRRNLIFVTCSAVVKNYIELRRPEMSIIRMKLEI